jgi:hypothetical protein
MGLKVSVNGIAMSDDKLEAIKALGPPSNKQELRSLLGYLNFIKKFIPNMSTHDEPLRVRYVSLMKCCCVAQE